MLSSVHSLADFSQSPAGYISGVIVPIMLTGLMGAIAYSWRRQSNRLDNIENAMGVQSRALAVLVESDTGDGQEIIRIRDRLHEVEGATAALKVKIELHDKWAEENKQRIDRSIERLETRGNI